MSEDPGATTNTGETENDPAVAEWFSEVRNVESLLAEERGPKMPPRTTDDEALRLTKEESRTILDHRLDWLSETDDKAMRTVRTAVIVLSIIFSAAGVIGGSELRAIPPIPLGLSVLGVGLLFLTIVYGIYTYSDSETVYGPEPALRREVLEYEYSEREWLVMLLNGYEEWIDVMTRVNKRNVKHLNRVQLLLVTSLFCLLLALVSLVLVAPNSSP